MRKLTKKILFQVNILAALALLIAYASNHITPIAIWPIAFFGLAYSYLLIINISFFGLWIWRKNRYGLLSLVVILIGFGNIGRYVQLHVEKDYVEDDSTDLRILTYNVRIFNNYKWSGNNFSRDSIIDFVNSEEPDIICFQEFVTKSNVNNKTERYTSSLLKKTPYKHIRYTTIVNNTRINFGIATYSKYPIIRKGSIHFENSYNTCIYSDLVFRKDTIRVYNLHLQSVSLKKNYTIIDSLVYINAQRIDEIKDISGRLKNAFIRRALQVDAVRDHIEASPYPVIVCGDFNDTPVSYSYQQLLGDKFDSFREAGIGIGKTYFGRFPSYRIDYIFHDKNFKTLDYSSPRVKLSYHYPVISTLKRQ